LNFETFLFELLQCCVDVDCVPKDNDIYNQSKRSKLIFLSFTISLAQLAPLSVEYGSSQFMTLFAFIELLEYATTLGLIVDVVDGVAAQAEVLYRDEIRRKLLTKFPDKP